MNTPVARRSSLTRFAWLSVAAALVTIGLKLAAYGLTSSVGLLSDALESVVNLVGAVMAVAMLTVSARPPDDEHSFGHDKAEYFSSGVEGTLILIAAAGIAWAAFPRLVTPAPIGQPVLGIVVSLVASLVNLGVARVLLRVGRLNNSITLEADARHLLTDVWTSVGVIAGVAAVALTGWERLDPIVALVVAANIVWTGFQLIRRSVLGLMDTALPPQELAKLQRVLDTYVAQGASFHALRTRQAGARRFVTVHVLVPGDWTVRRGHALLEQIERDLRHVLSNMTVLTHLEARDDPASFQDTALDRPDISATGQVAPMAAPRVGRDPND